MKSAAFSIPAEKVTRPCISSADNFLSTLSTSLTLIIELISWENTSPVKESKKINTDVFLMIGLLLLKIPQCGINLESVRLRRTELVGDISHPQFLLSALKGGANG